MNNWDKTKIVLKAIYHGVPASLALGTALYVAPVEEWVPDSVGTKISRPLQSFRNAVSHYAAWRKGEAAVAPVPIEGISLLRNRPSQPGCASNADSAAMANEVPRLSYEFEIMRRLPISGAGIYAQLKDLNNGIISCIVADASDGEDKRHGFYHAGQVFIDDEASSLTTFHEYFHAVQNIEGPRNWERLTKEDAKFSLLLEEATAAAYSLVIERDAANHGKKLYAYATSGMSSSADNVRPIFEHAYHKFFKEYSFVPLDLRQAKAMEGAGQMVVRYFLQGESASWSNFYAKQTKKNMEGNEKYFQDDGREKRGDYSRFRADAYKNSGRVSDLINLTPPEFYGADAEDHINDCLKKHGLEKKSIFSRMFSRAPDAHPFLGA